MSELRRGSTPLTTRLSGATVGPPAPPRDGIGDIGDLMECFDF
jgi:hypothetical protein